VEIPGPFGLANYNWEKLVAGVFVPYSASQNLQILPPGGKFRLIGSNAWGCADSTDTLDVTFMDCCPAVELLCVDTCVNFDTNSLQGFVPDPAAPNVGLMVTNLGSQGGPLDYFVKATDLVGSSQLLAGDQFDGKWCCGEFCFDYKVFDDALAGSVGTNPSFTIRNGSLGFRFISAISVNEKSPWIRICAPISDCDSAPVSGAGVWLPLAGTLATDWPTVLSNVTDVNFRVDFNLAVGETSGFDNICLGSSSPAINAGNDTTVCSGSVLALHVEGCSGVPVWNVLSGDSLIYYGTGETIDVVATQNTCYVVICCGVTACCCDTDTVCVNVRPLPILQWSTVYPSVCQNASPIFLDSANVLQYVGGNWVPLSGGTGFFSGPYVVGNIFTPSVSGNYTICYNYTDSTGCSKTICNTINVIICCDSSFNIDAGPDQVICEGNPAILTVIGCSGAAQWFKMTAVGPVPVGQGETIDVMPQVSTCYIVTCCLTPLCCDTDTVCVIVNPHPVLSWVPNLPTLCVNSSLTLDSTQILIYINNAWVPLSTVGGTGYFSGPYVTGNVFTPTLPGTYYINYTYTDSAGCSASVGTTIEVIVCCDSTFNISAGADTVICRGSYATLTVTGCIGTPQWFRVSANGLIPVGQGEILDVSPPFTTCFVVICCITPACCDTDTVCVGVTMPPLLQWQETFPDLCSNSAPITLNPNNVFVNINNTWVMAPFAGGTGYFSGPGVVGNVFTPGAPGSYTICYTYTDIYGCSSTVCKTINVIVCCDSTFNIDAGPDQVICEGNPAILTVSGCNGAAQWFKMSATGGLVSIGQGETIDVLPQTSTCYVVICCITTLCCDTDTVCVTVTPPPVLIWPTVYPEICSNGGPVILDPASVFVDVNNTWVMAPFAGGTGYFSGPGVVGNVFTPTAPGTYTICYTYTDIYGCSSTICNTITVIVCCDPTFNIDAGPDQGICAGQPAILTVNGCKGAAQWFKMSATGGLVSIGQGETVDVLPQTSTCYVVICCLTPACCDTDTVCVIVKPLPILHWSNQYPEICVNATYVLNPMDVQVLINNTYVNAPLAGGSGFFSGPNVVGNSFTPTSPGTYTICYTYTAPNGCSQTICNTISVIECCDTTFTISAGPDQSICAGEVAILTVSGCNGVPKWYQVTDAGPVLVWQGEVFDAMPQVSTCYIVTCCITPDCCYSDTVCVTVKPNPILQWSSKYPNICVGSSFILNAAHVQVLINNSWVNASIAGGAGVFSGPFVVGNTFTPTTPGTYTICYTYTDANGCSNTICNTFTVIVCCDPTFNINAGPDQTICAGQAAILRVIGCNGIPQWYQQGVEGLIPVGQGPIVDVMPQTTTCYIVICCISPLCCDTDTVCVTVRPAPVLHWSNQYPEICAGSSFTLNPSHVQVLINNTWVNAPLSGGTGVFSGPFVVGNTFTPTTPGTYTICYTYTDANGCSNTICNTFTVIVCCDPTFNINAGPDLVICQGNQANLTVTGCNGLPQWYQLTVEGPIFAGEGEAINVTPQQTVCYMVICCITPTCCDTDTVCVTVNPSAGSPQWMVSYASVCQYGVPLMLEPSNIFYTNVIPWLPVTQAGGTGFFSGQSVVGNYFYPSTLGTHTITYTYTDVNGCVYVLTNTITVISCGCGPCYRPGTEMIVNGGFESGNTGFISSVTSSCTCTAGTYCVHTNAMSKCATNQNVTAAGTPTGSQFMIVDGNMSPVMLWRQNAVIVPAKTYNFSFWVYGSLGAVGSPNPDLQVRVGGIPVMTLPGASILPSWRRYFVQFSGVSGTTIEIHQLTGGAIGTGYGIDDISLKPCVRNINITFNPVTAVSCHGLSDGGATGVVTGGSQPYTYEWSSGEVSEVLTNKVAGIYTMTVIDGVGCNHFEAVDITQPDPILISGFTPTSGATGTQVVITGSGFTNVNQVAFNGIFTSAYNVDSPTQITATVPQGITSGFITVSNASGCSGTSAGVFTVNTSVITLNLQLYLQGFYIGNGLLTPVLFNTGLSTDNTIVDTVRVELHAISPQYSMLAATNGILHTDGTMTVNFPATFMNGDYYIVIRHRNSIETWSKFPVHLGSTTNYNFKF
jgi:hypothetical protein